MSERDKSNDSIKILSALTNTYKGSVEMQSMTCQMAKVVACDGSRINLLCGVDERGNGFAFRVKDGLVLFRSK